ncbi:hypothetical protein [Virgibacillus sp. Bac330]|uniref:hypothetical protein n=1 Tax=Virgibacillus sp. Bac330 TaxID=2419841 RepID=UPI000EF48B32|nr:hypothetical protein [Virgibacillus sp. Bac330]
MKQNIFKGSFSQVEGAVSESFAKNSINMVKRFKTIKAIAFIVFFIGLGSYAYYGLSVFMINNMDRGTIPLDVNNEFIPVFSSIWYMHIQAMLVLVAALAAYIYREKNNIKGVFIYNVFLTIAMLLFFTFSFKLAQLIVNNFYLRMTYTILFVISYLYVFFRSYQNAKEMVYGTKKKRSEFVEWFSQNRKNVTSILFGVGVLYYLTKVIFSEANDLETKIMGSLIDFAPLAVCLASLLFLYFNSVAIRSYYLYKYMDKFRQKFGVAEAEWYGQKYKP